jgi:isopentenyl diphosphate isomerase/L-lactate dehydrogenase-like FMN-dependent dehydrogenase
VREKQRGHAAYPIHAISPEPLNVFEYERLAEEKLDPAAYAYFAGGAGDELTLRDNVEAFRRYRLRPRVLAEVSEVDTSIELLGQTLSLPLLVAPMAFQRLIHPDGELAMARAAARAGTAYCLSTLATATVEEVAEAAPECVRWFQLYVFADRGLTRALLEEAAAAGFSAVVLTVDLPPVGRRERELRTGLRIPEEQVPSLVRADVPGGAFSVLATDLSWRDVERFAEQSGLPVVVKGILTEEGALLACENGAAGIVVSNHGGRQLDGVQASLDALPEVVEAVAGRVPVLMDGGVCRGTDVAKALALGADAVLAGRAVAWGLAVNGEDGAARVLELMREELEVALFLLGCSSPAEVTPAHLLLPAR